MYKVHVGVLRGGPSSEYEVSLKTGGQVLKHLPDKYHSHDILITKDGLWHMAGVPRDPESILKHLDVVFNALHGEYGEDGKVQSILESHNKCYTGSRSLPSAMAMNKELTKKWFKKEGIKTPLSTVVERGEDIKKRAVHLFKTFPQPSIIKPISHGSSFGISVAHTIPEITLALEHALDFSPKAIVEEFIQGKEATCGIVDDFRGERRYTLLPVEIIKGGNSRFHDYHSKYGGKSKIISPGNFRDEESTLMRELALKAHVGLGLRHYSRSDFIVHPKRGIYFLEVNTLPGLTVTCPFPNALNAVGVSLSDFLDHLIGLALEEK